MARLFHFVFPFCFLSHLEADPEAARKADAAKAEGDPQGEQTHTHKHAQNADKTRSVLLILTLYFLLSFFSTVLSNLLPSS